jgi:hypothetical protein
MRKKWRVRECAEKGVRAWVLGMGKKVVPDFFFDFVFYKFSGKGYCLSFL